MTAIQRMVETLLSLPKAHIAAQPEEKWCKLCDTVKPLGEFPTYRNRRRNGKVHNCRVPYCRSCNSKRITAYKRAARERAKREKTS